MFYMAQGEDESFVRGLYENFKAGVLRTKYCIDDYAEFLERADKGGPSEEVIFHDFKKDVALFYIKHKDCGAGCIH